MAKKFFGRLVTLAAVAGAVAAVVTYVKQYTKFNKNLDDEFYDFEDVEEDSNRKYTALKNSTDEFISSAKETANVAKSMVAPAKDIINEVSQIVVAKVKDATGVAKEDKADELEPDFDTKEIVDDTISTVEDKAGELKEDLVKNVDKVVDSTSVVEEEF